MSNVYQLIFTSWRAKGLLHFKIQVSCLRNQTYIITDMLLYFKISTVVIINKFNTIKEICILFLHLICVYLNDYITI